MTTLKPVLLFICISAFLLGCKKESSSPYVCSDCVSSSEAKQEFDWSTKGIYKGVVVGSSGTIKFDVMNYDASAIRAILKLDGQTTELTSTKPWTSDLGYEAEFKGTLNGQTVSLVLSLGVGGTVVDVMNVTIPGHPGAAILAAKETSTALVEGFEGTFEGRDGPGIINFLLVRNSKRWYAEIKLNGSQRVQGANGEIVNNEIKDYDGTYIATISNHEISGTPKDSDGSLTKIYAKRTL